jgi:hypothetical protein
MRTLRYDRFRDGTAHAEDRHPDGVRAAGWDLLKLIFRQSLVVIAGGVAVFACAVPTRRAVQGDPTNAFRHE